MTENNIRNYFASATKEAECSTSAKPSIFTNEARACNLQSKKPKSNETCNSLVSSKSVTDVFNVKMPSVESRIGRTFAFNEAWTEQYFCIPAKNQQAQFLIGKSILVGKSTILNAIS